MEEQNTDLNEGLEASAEGDEVEDVLGDAASKGSAGQVYSPGGRE